MHPIKYVWVLRAIGYKLFFKKVGLKTYIGKPMFVSGAERISIGSRTRIFPGMRMEAIGEGSIEIGNNTVIEQNVHIIAKVVSFDSNTGLFYLEPVAITGR